MTLKQQIIHDYLIKFPNASTYALARAILRENSLVWAENRNTKLPIAQENAIEYIRGLIRVARGGSLRGKRGIGYQFQGKFYGQTYEQRKNRIRNQNPPDESRYGPPTVRTPGAGQSVQDSVGTGNNPRTGELLNPTGHSPTVSQQGCFDDFRIAGQKAGRRHGANQRRPS